MLMVNVSALTVLTRLLLPGMRERGFGAILNLASVASFVPVPQMSVYAATKAYVLSFTEGLWQELKEQPISVTAVCPGPVATEFFDVAEMDINSARGMVIQKPEEVAALAYKALCANKRMRVSSSRLNLMRLFMHFIPKRLLLPLIEWMNKAK